MKIVTARRICQGFFLALFLWFCVVTTLGDGWWQLRGWPVNWMIQLDPLVGLATLLSTRTVYAGLLWGLATIVLTIILGRFFCGWVCPFGSIHQAVGFLARRNRTTSEKIKLNRYHPGQSIKYWILIFLLTLSALELAIDLMRLPETHRLAFRDLDSGHFDLDDRQCPAPGTFEPKKKRRCVFDPDGGLAAVKHAL